MASAARRQIIGGGGAPCNHQKIGGCGVSKLTAVAPAQGSSRP